jgi:osmotically inducible protein OsmC
MAKVLYTAEAHVTGGRDEGHGKTSDGNLEVDIRVPKELGGDEDKQGTNPEQLFAVGYAACFESAIKVVGRRLKQKVEDVEIDSKVHLMPENRGFKLAVEMDVELPSVKEAEMRSEVIKNAHAVCPYSNATRGNIDVTIRVDGKEVGSTSEESAPESKDDSSGSNGDSKTKEELLEKAKELDIEGRSKMTKDELAEAVEKAE